MLRQQLRRDARFDAEHQFETLVAGLHRFRRKLRDAGDKADIGRDHQIRGGIKDQPRFAAKRQQARLFGGQKESHIDVGEIDHVQHPTTGGQHFPRLGDAILNTAVAGRLQLAIVNIGKDPPLGRLGGFDAGLRLNNAGAGGLDGGAGGGDLGFRRLQRRAGALCRGAIVIQLLGGDGAALRQGIRADVTFRCGVELRLTLLHNRFAGAHFTLPLIEQGSGGQDRAFRFLDLRGGFKTLLVQYTGIHSRQHLSLAHELTLFDQNGVDTSGDFAGNIHLGGFYSSVATGKPLREARRAQQPPCRGGEYHQ